MLTKIADTSQVKPFPDGWEKVHPHPMVLIKLKIFAFNYEIEREFTHP